MSLDCRVYNIEACKQNNIQLERERIGRKSDSVQQQCVNRRIPLETVFISLDASREA